MPYIPKSDRLKFDAILEDLPEIKTKGELEYIIFVILKRNFMLTREWKYSQLHDAVYGCIHAGEEFKRRYLDKREDRAIDDNGDI